MLASVPELTEYDSVCIIPNEGFFKYIFPARIMTDPRFVDNAEQLFNLFKAEPIFTLPAGPAPPHYQIGFSRETINRLHADIKAQNLFNFPWKDRGFALWYPVLHM